MGESGAEDKPMVGGNGLVTSVKSIRSDIFTLRDRRSKWVRGLIDRRGKTKAAVALANKNARIAWVLLKTDAVYIAEDAAA